MTLIGTCDLVITVAYFSIPFQILVSLWKSPPHREIPIRLVVTLVLFAFFIFLCGTGHLMRYMDKGHTTSFIYVHVSTALVSLVTAVYLIPLIPCMFSLLDESLNKLTNETKESKSKLFTFMAFLCHEIRNPLFAITSSAEFLKDTPLHPDQAEEVSSICDSSLLMLRLVNDVLDLSKLDSGKLELEAREFDLSSLLHRLGENMTRQVTRKHKGTVQMIFEMSNDVPKVIIGDSCRILQIVYNLLSNSVKFCSTGNIKLRVRLANEAREREEQEADIKAGAQTVTMSSDRSGSILASDIDEGSASREEEKGLFSMALLDGDDLEQGESGTLLPNNPDESIMVLSITVSDTGIGIPTERLKNIFEPYTQAKLSDFRQHGGTGLGLSIISSLIKAMGGNISVTSKEGLGTKFHLKIPVRVPHNPTLGFEDDGHEGAGMNFGDEGNHAKSDNNFLQARRLPVFEDPTSPTKGKPTNQAALFALGPEDSTSNAPPPSTKPSPLFSLDSRQASDLDDSGRLSPTRKRDPSPPAPLPSFDFPPRSNVILVVDDNQVNRKILGKMLKTYKLEYETACNGKEAVDILLQSRNATGDLSRPQFGLVFMDVSMPVMDGNTAIKTIRHHKISVPIVALSANVLSQERDRTICLGADEFHTKPILRNDLHVLCTRFLYKNGQAPSEVSMETPRVESFHRKASTGSTTSALSLSDTEVEDRLV